MCFSDILYWYVSTPEFVKHEMNVRMYRYKYSMCVLHSRYQSHVIPVLSVQLI